MDNFHQILVEISFTRFLENIPNSPQTTPFFKRLLHTFNAVVTCIWSFNAQNNLNHVNRVRIEWEITLPNLHCTTPLLEMLNFYFNISQRSNGPVPSGTYIKGYYNLNEQISTDFHWDMVHLVFGMLPPKIDFFSMDFYIVLMQQSPAHNFFMLISI